MLLLEQNLPEEALQLSRPQFEEALKLRELGDSTGAQRLGLVIRHVHDGLTERRHLFNVGDNPKLLEFLKTEQRKLADFARANNVLKYPKFLSVAAAAEKYDRLPDWGLYKLTHQFVHGTDVALVFNRDKPEPNHMMVRDRTTTLWVQLMVAIFASLSLVEATKGTAKAFGWSGVDTLAALQDQFDEIHERIKAHYPQVG